MDNQGLWDLWAWVKSGVVLQARRPFGFGFRPWAKTLTRRVWGFHFRQRRSLLAPEPRGFPNGRLKLLHRKRLCQRVVNLETRQCP